MRTVSISFIMGCPRSGMDTAMLFNYFRANGWRVTNRIGDADLVLLAGCAFSNYVESKSFKYIALAMKKKQPEVPAVAIGCLPGICETRLTEQFDVIPLSRANLHRLDDICQSQIKVNDIRDDNVPEATLHLAESSFGLLDRLRVRLSMAKDYYLKGLLQCYVGAGEKSIYPSEGLYSIRLARGCLEDCSYCAIKLASGTLKSKPLGLIMDEFKAGLSQGYKTFRLVAEDVGAYGQDTGTSIADLLGELFSQKGDFRLTWTDFHPRWLVKYFHELRAALADNPARMASVGFPVQSGSQRILDRMARAYDIKEVQSCLKGLKEACDGLPITTHALVGFPGETQEDFAQTIGLLDSIGFRGIEIYDYSPRPNTKALEFTDRVSNLQTWMRAWQLCKRFRHAIVIQ